MLDIPVDGERPAQDLSQGLGKVSGQALFCFAAYNLTRLANLLVFVPKVARPESAPRRIIGAKSLESGCERSGKTT